MAVSRRQLVGSAGMALGLGGSGAVVYGSLSGRPAADPAVLVAGSLLSVATELGGAAVEAHGSAGVRRLVVEGARDPDAVALADPRLFDGIADRAALFATNALVVAYDPESTHADAIEGDWVAALTDPDVRVGRTDPRVDPLGYRTVMALRLAERFYGLSADRVLEAAPVLPETDLLNVLEGGGVDAAVVYRNMAVERGLPAVDLPTRIDFSDPDRAAVYGSVSVRLDDRTLRGRPIRYGAAALTDRGSGWVDRLVTATDRLREHGFVVPSGYPERDVRVGGRS